MSTYTTNYNLEKPDSTDDFKDFRSNYNSNMDIIDANLGGGGGGNVDDVLVNGVSVVDGNHDAQITSYKEVTQAEYDALPATKLTDGIAYFIKDAGGGGGGSSSHNYSTTEQVIGTWIDGKPLYEKTMAYLGLDIRNTNRTLSTGITDAETIVYMGGTYKRTNDGSDPVLWEPVPVGHTNASAFTVSANDFDTSDGTIVLVVGAMSNWFRVNDCYITIRYTKTTD